MESSSSFLSSHSSSHASSGSKLELGLDLQGRFLHVPDLSIGSLREHLLISELSRKIRLIQHHPASLCEKFFCANQHKCCVISAKIYGILQWFLTIAENHTANLYWVSFLSVFWGLKRLYMFSLFIFLSLHFANFLLLHF